MGFETIRFEETGDVATITFLQPRTNMVMVKELTKVFNVLEDESKANAVVFRGTGGVFCKGIDFADFKPGTDMDIHGFNQWEKLVVRVERLPKITIAAMEGPVVGGGVQLALAADARLATMDATFNLPEVKLGFLPGMATYRLARYVGLGRAKRIILRCETLSAADALGLGIVDTVTDDLDAGIAAAIESFRPFNTVAASLARRLLNESFDTGFENAIGNFLAAQHRCMHQNPFLDTVKKAQEG